MVVCCVLHHLADSLGFFREVARVLKSGGRLIVAEPRFPIIIKPFVDYIVFPLLRAGDNKSFTHRRLRKLFTSNNFDIIYSYKKEMKQIVVGEKI